MSSADISISLTFPIGTSGLETSAMLLASVIAEQLTLEQMKHLRLSMEVVGNELKRIIVAAEVQKQREDIEKEKLSWKADKNLSMSKWRKREILKEQRSPRGKADDAIRKLTNGALDVSDFLMMAKVFCPEHKKLKTECGCA